MKKIIIKILNAILYFGLIFWVAVILADFIKVKTGKDPKYCIKEELKYYDDGTVYSCTGLGYKFYKYDRKSISAMEFGPFFIKEKNS